MADVLIKNLIWFVTSKCNLQCKHCYYYESDDKCYKGELSTEDALRVLRNVSGWGVGHIHFLGGEPTLREDFLDILAACRDLGMTASFGTNAQLIDYEYAQGLVKLGVRTVTLSFEGPDQETNDAIRGEGTFQRSLETLGYLKQARSRSKGSQPLSIFLEIGLNRTWSERISDMGKLVEFIKPDGFILEPTKAEGRALKANDEISLFWEERLDLMPQLVEMISRIPDDVYYSFSFYPKWVEYGNLTADCQVRCEGHLCLALTPQCHITAAGKVIPCPYTPKIIGWEGVPDARYSTLEEVYGSSHFQTFLKLWKKGIKEKPAACKSCGYSHLMCEVCPIAPMEEKEWGTSFCKEAMKRIKEIKRQRGEE